MRYRVGAALARELEPVASFVEIAEYLGTTKQNAYTFTVLALGKLAFALRDRLAEPPR
jgi:hypothetical protein